MATPAIIPTSVLPTIVLVGRVNVGKSTLFNRLIEENKAIVSAVPGTTRTSNEGNILWRGMSIHAIDTGGLTFSDDVLLEDDIIKQTERALTVANLIVFVTDGQTGILPQERELAKRLWKHKEIPILLVANKIDKIKDQRALDVKGYASLNLGEPFSISASSGKNTGDLLDHIYTMLEGQILQPKAINTTSSDNTINIAIIGKPNVGKSSLFNKLVGEDRVIVSDMPHTTREPHDLVIEYVHGNGESAITYKIKFIDTAGIRRKAKVGGVLERAGIGKSLDAVSSADMILFVLDGSEPLSSQDQQLGGLLERHGKSAIIILNKWDLTPNNSEPVRREVTKRIHTYFPHLNFSPILFVSGKTGLRVHEIFPMIFKVWKARHTEIPERTLETFLKQATTLHRPSRGKGTRHPQVLGMRQINVAPPVFEIIIKYRTSLHRSYMHFLENKLREQFDFIGTPIIIKLTKQKR